MGTWKKLTLVCIAAAVLGAAGCASGADHALGEPEIIEPQNHLEAWQKELPQDTKAGGLNANAVRGMVVQKDGEVTFAVSYEPREEKDSFDYWDISVPYHSTVTVNTEELYGLFGTAAMLGWTKAEDIGLEEAGLTDTATSIFLAYDKDQGAGEKGAQEPNAARTILVGKENGQGGCYTALADSGEVYVADSLLIDALLEPDPYTYILKIPVLINVDTVAGVRIVCGGEVHQMEQGEDTWKLDNKQVSEKEFHELFGKLLDITVTGEIADEADSQKTGEAVLALQFFRNMEGASDAEVIYETYDETSLRVSVNGHKYFLVKKEDVDALINALK